MPESQVLHQNSKSTTPSTEIIQIKFDLAIALALSTWSSLTLAIREQWGGPNSSEKRDWFAGAISELFENSPDSMDGEYLEEFMLQVMNDEFEVNVEDGSGEPIAELIIKLRKEICRGTFSRLDDMFSAWKEKQKLGCDDDTIGFSHVQDEDNDTEWDDEGDEEEEEEEEEDNAMDIDIPSKPTRVKPAIEIDEDGFTKVVGRRKADIAVSKPLRRLDNME